MPLRKIAFWAKMMFLRGQTTEFHMCEYLLSCLLCHTALVFAFDRLLISQVTPESQMSLVRLTESRWEEDSEEILSHGLQSSQHVSSQRALCDVLCRNWSGIH